MPFPHGGWASYQQAQPVLEPQFDIFTWYPHFRSCLRYFLDYAQYEYPIQALAAFMNIQLPFQKVPHPILNSRPSYSPGIPPSSSVLGMSGPGSGQGPVRPPSAMDATQQPICHIPLLPYVRRLVATGCDSNDILHGFFGDNWMAGIGWLRDQERRNYLFASKSTTWQEVKASYDIEDGQTIPFLRPLRDVSEEEIVNSETTWSDWLAMQDWMLGPRAPNAMAVEPTGVERGVHGVARRHHLPPDTGSASPRAERPKRDSS